MKNRVLDELVKELDELKKEYYLCDYCGLKVCGDCLVWINGSHYCPTCAEQIEKVKK